MSRAIEQKNSRDGFVKPGELIDIRTGAELSLQDPRIFNLLIENAWSEIGEDRPHRIAMSRLRGPHRGSERVADSVKRLMTTLVEVPTMLEGQAAIFTTQLCGETTRMIDEDSPNAVLIYNFPKDAPASPKDRATNLAGFVIAGQRVHHESDPPRGASSCWRSPPSGSLAQPAARSLAVMMIGETLSPARAGAARHRRGRGGRSRSCPSCSGRKIA